MKAFLEEYGMVIVMVIVIATIIGLAVYVSRNGGKRMQTTYENFTKTGDNALNQANQIGTGGMSNANTGLVDTTTGSDDGSAVGGSGNGGTNP